jgi:hypothetical protein
MKAMWLCDRSVGVKISDLVHTALSSILSLGVTHHYKAMQPVHSTT